MQKWEYHTCYLAAEADKQKEYLQQRWPWPRGVPKYAPQALIPQLDKFGEEGWELISMDPVYIGVNEDIRAFQASGTGRPQDTWVHSYLCVFKRPREA